MWQQDLDLGHLHLCLPCNNMDRCRHSIRNMHSTKAEAAQGLSERALSDSGLSGCCSCTTRPYLSAACACVTLLLHRQALAYAVARLPSCYAAAHRIFKELAVRYPGFEPKTLLDFGAGPGTATWAAQEVCPVVGPHSFVKVPLMGSCKSPTKQPSTSLMHHSTS